MEVGGPPGATRRSATRAQRTLSLWRAVSAILPWMAMDRTCSRALEAAMKPSSQLPARVKLEAVKNLVAVPKALERCSLHPAGGYVLSAMWNAAEGEDPEVRHCMARKMKSDELQLRSRNAALWHKCDLDLWQDEYGALHEEEPDAAVHEDKPDAAALGTSSPQDQIKGDPESSDEDDAVHIKSKSEKKKRKGKGDIEDELAQKKGGDSKSKALEKGDGLVEGEETEKKKQKKDKKRKRDNLGKSELEGEKDGAESSKEKMAKKREADPEETADSKGGERNGNSKGKKEKKEKKEKKKEKSGKTKADQDCEVDGNKEKGTTGMKRTAAASNDSGDETEGKLDQAPRQKKNKNLEQATGDQE
eukprot:gene11636-13743_t